MGTEPPPPRPFRLGISHWYSADNLGDVAILEGQLRLLQSHGLQPVVVLGVDSSARPPDSAGGAEFACVPWPSPATAGVGPWLWGLIWAITTLLAPRSRVRPARFQGFVRLISSLDALMPKGGGYLYSRSGVRGVLFTLRICWPLLLARRLGVRRLVWGHSIGPADTGLGARLLRAAITGADVIVRDDASSALLERWGLPHRRGPDFAFAFAARTPTPDHRPRRRPVTVGVTARTIGEPTTQRAYEDALVAALDRLADDVHMETGRDMRLSLVPQVTGPLPDEDDRPVLRRIGERVRCETAIAALTHSDVARAVDQYQELDFLLATRLHSALLASCAAVPFVVYEYIGGKARGVARDLGLPDWVVVDQPSELVEAVARGWQQREALVASYRRSLPNIVKALVVTTYDGLDAAVSANAPARRHAADLRSPAQSVAIRR
jgi:polysaccharide pyruvyl transferase WcaK-like protein